MACHVGKNSAKINLYLYCAGNLYEDIYHGIYVFNHIVHVSKPPIYHVYSRKIKNKLKVVENMENDKLRR